MTPVVPTVTDTAASPHERIVARLRAALAAGDHVCLMLDYDGTLTPIVPRPENAWVTPTLREQLRALSVSGRVTVAVVSGRSLADVKSRITLPAIVYAGCHGLQIEGPRLSYVHPGAVEKTPMLRGLIEELEPLTRELPGVMIESKGLSVAVHYRNAAPGVQDRVVARLQLAISTRPGFTVLPGRRVFEILPVVDAGKGLCALRIQAAVRATRGRTTSVYIGDDVTDELAFRALGPEAVTVKVGGTGPTWASQRINDVADVHRILSTLRAILHDGGGP